MADQAGTTLHGYGRCPEYSEFFPMDSFNLGRSTCGGSVGWCNQSTFQPTIPRLIRRKRRAGGRVVTVSDAGPDVGSEGSMWGTPRKRALFGLEGQHSVSSVSDVADAQLGWLPDNKYPEVAQSGWPPDDKYIEEARSPIVDLADVAQLQK